MTLFNNVEEKKQDQAVIASPGIDVEGTLTEALAQTKFLYPDILKLANDTRLSLSTVTSIESDEQDEYAADVLVKARNNYELINKQRMSITGPIDKIKTALMAPEKMISTLAEDKDSDYNKVRTMRNDWAAKKEKERLAKIEAAKKEQAKQEEITRLKGVFEMRVFEGKNTVLRVLEDSIVDHISSMTLENWDKAVERFNLKPQLKADHYNGWFNVPFNQNALPAEEYKAFVTDMVIPAFPYADINAEYVEKANAMVARYKESLPAHKAKLEEIAATALKSKAEAEAMHKKLDDEREEKRKADEAKQKEENDKKQAEITAAQERENLDHAFEAQVKEQEATALGVSRGARTIKKAQIVAPQEQTLVVISKILLGVYTNPEFPGHFKTDKSGTTLFKNERPVYADWLQEILDLHVKFGTQPVEGVDFYNVVATTARAKKTTKK